MTTVNGVGVLTEEETTRVRKICEDLLIIYEAEKVEVCTNMHLDGSGCDICIEITNSLLYKNLAKVGWAGEAENDRK